MRTGALSLLLAALLLAGCGKNRDQLLADLQSPRPELRAQAVKRLAAQGKPDDLVLFSRAAKDVSAQVRAEAAEALGGSTDPRVVDLLGELLDDPDEQVQGRAAMALAASKSDQAKAYLTSQYGRHGRATRLAIVQALQAASVPGAMAAGVAAESKALWGRNLLLLNEGSLPERVAAAEEVGKSGRGEAVNLLMPLVRDAQVRLAAAAVRGLGWTGDKAVADSIAPLLEENFPELREAASVALARLGDVKAVNQLRAVATEKSAASPAATDALIQLPRSAETDGALCAVVLDGAAPDALAAGYALARRDGCPLEPVFERLKSPATAATGLRALAALGPKSSAALPRVLPLLAPGTDAELRTLAVEAVGAMRERSAVPNLLELLKAEEARLASLRGDWVTARPAQGFARGFEPAAGAPAQPPRGAVLQGDALLASVRALNAERAARPAGGKLQPRPPAELVDDADAEQLELLAAILPALGALDAPGALDVLKRSADDPSLTLRTAARVGLARLGPPGIALAREGLMEPDRELQRTVARALAAQGPAGQGALVELLPTLPDKAPALEALVEHGAPASGAEALEAVVRGGGAEVALAAQLLGRLKSSRSVPALVEALEDPSSAARPEVLRALGEIGDRQAADAVAKDLYNDVPEVRAAAARALGRIGTGAQGEALDALKGDYHRQVRDAAAQALASLGTPEASR